MDTKKKIEQILKMMNAVTDLDENTQDAEMSKYFKGFKEGLDWVVTVVLREERICNHIVLKVESNNPPSM